MEIVQENARFSPKDHETFALSGYEIIRPLGKGGFSKVVLVRKKSEIPEQYKKKETGDVREKCLVGGVACKISSRTDLALREAEILAGIDHPLFPEYIEVLRDDGKVFLLMEYICGSSLESLLVRRGRFCDAQAVRIGLELAEGLKYLHERPQPILFRDVKPANIMIRQDGRVKLLDLGCSCCVGERSNRAGTPEYAAPEQLKNTSPVTPASDVYGLGKTMWAITSGNCGKKLNQVISACLREQPNERIPDMRGVISALATLEEKGGRLRMPGDFSRSRAVCVDNVWESTHKETAHPHV